MKALVLSFRINVSIKFICNLITRKKIPKHYFQKYFEQNVQLFYLSSFKTFHFSNISRTHISWIFLFPIDLFSQSFLIYICKIIKIYFILIKYSTANQLVLGEDIITTSRPTHTTAVQTKVRNCVLEKFAFIKCENFHKCLGKKKLKIFPECLVIEHISSLRP